MNKTMIIETNQKKKILIFFIVSMLLLFMMFLIMFLINPQGSQANIFYDKTNDYMADFFNVAKFSSDRNPYFNEFKGSYFPFSYLIFYFLSKFAPYDAMPAFQAGKTTMGLVTSTYFMFFLSTVYLIELFSLSTLKKQCSFFLILTFLFSGIFIFAFERGNLIILAACLVSFYINYYDSHNKVLKELALLALAFAAALKVYPALLGILLLYEKKHNDAIRLIIYGVIVAFLPFIFFEHGLSNALQLLKNMETASDFYKFMYYPRYGYTYFVSIWARSYSLRNFISTDIVNIFATFGFYIYTIIGFFLNKNEISKWKQIAFVILIIIFLPVNSGLYCGLYLLPIIIMFFNQEHLGKQDWLYVILFIIILNPIQIPFWKININTLLQNIAILILLFDFSYSQVHSFTRRRNSRITQ
ncbi:hypothetical protein SDC9_60617 [bioreactor metagenome]|uniref:Glycosyltransferase RgtA/B/C/D-like domain-containing protein n=1 Tax=bioreactor metagenome TaxID=1076179 RepID=A0A644XDI5_9ZZZZ